tara:strand:- start:43 stop:240 length:198 start_codon:yes stop_codon:yes gene_type:complete
MKRKDIRTYGIIMGILYISAQFLDAPLNDWLNFTVILLGAIVLVIVLYNKFQSGELRKWWRKKKK